MKSLPRFNLAGAQFEAQGGAAVMGRAEVTEAALAAVETVAGRQYEILSGTESNLARHGRRKAGEFFRMLTF